MSYYAEKLLDPRWQKRRLEILQRDGFACVLCKCKDKTLHVHHLGYAGEPWEAPNDWLETLCERCHSLRPGLDKAISNGIQFIPSPCLFHLLCSFKQMRLSQPWEMGQYLKLTLDLAKEQMTQMGETPEK